MRSSFDDFADLVFIFTAFAAMVTFVVLVFYSIFVVMQTPYPWMFMISLLIYKLIKR